MDEFKPPVKLSAEEQRVLAALIEKSKTTPDYYPMTLNGLLAACNQKSARNPVVNYSEETVNLTLNQLKIKGLISTAVGGSSRAIKYKHNLAIVYPLLPSEVAILCLLLLRGPLTPGEINANSARLFDFESIEDIVAQLNKLAQEECAYVKQLPKKPGQKEARYVHLFGDFEEESFTALLESNEEVATNNFKELESRVLKLEQEIELLKNLLDLN